MSSVRVSSVQRVVFSVTGPPAPRQTDNQAYMHHFPQPFRLLNRRDISTAPLLFSSLGWSDLALINLRFTWSYSAPPQYSANPDLLPRGCHHEPLDDFQVHLWPPSRETPTQRVFSDVVSCSGAVDNSFTEHAMVPRDLPNITVGSQIYGPVRPLRSRT